MKMQLLLLIFSQTLNYCEELNTLLKLKSLKVAEQIRALTGHGFETLICPVTFLPVTPGHYLNPYHTTYKATHTF